MQQCIDPHRLVACDKTSPDPSAVDSYSGACALFRFLPSTFATTPNPRRGAGSFDVYFSADATAGSGQMVGGICGPARKGQRANG